MVRVAVWEGSWTADAESLYVEERGEVTLAGILIGTTVQTNVDVKCEEEIRMRCCEV